MSDEDREARRIALAEEAKRAAADPVDRAEVKRLLEEWEPLSPEWPENDPQATGLEELR
jgi:formiminotetrahydrofolate cyclodeaminase